MRHFHHMINSQKWSVVVVPVGVPKITSNLPLSIHLKPRNVSSVIILRFQKTYYCWIYNPKCFSLKSVFWVLFFFFPLINLYYLFLPLDFYICIDSETLFPLMTLLTDKSAWKGKFIRFKSAYSYNQQILARNTFQEFFLVLNTIILFYSKIKL